MNAHRLESHTVSVSMARCWLARCASHGRPLRFRIRASSARRRRSDSGVRIPLLALRRRLLPLLLGVPLPLPLLLLLRIGEPVTGCAAAAAAMRRRVLGVSGLGLGMDGMGRGAPARPGDGGAVAVSSICVLGGKGQQGRGGVWGVGRSVDRSARRWVCAVPALCACLWWFGWMCVWIGLVSRQSAHRSDKPASRGGVLLGLVMGRVQIHRVRFRRGSGGPIDRQSISFDRSMVLWTQSGHWGHRGSFLSFLDRSRSDDDSVIRGRLLSSWIACLGWGVGCCSSFYRGTAPQIPSTAPSTRYSSTKWAWGPRIDRSLPPSTHPRVPTTGVSVGRSSDQLLLLGAHVTDAHFPHCGVTSLRFLSSSMIRVISNQARELWPSHIYIYFNSS